MIVSPKVQVWCDVGGTFTDCVVTLLDGATRSMKVLSHGCVQGSISNVSNDAAEQGYAFNISGRHNDPDGFWERASLKYLGVHGANLGAATCSQYRSGTFYTLHRPPLDAVGIEIDLGLEAPVLATRLLLGIPPSLPLPPLMIRLGTTRGTNALLTRTGAKTLFVTTQGFRDLLAIGYQERPQLFDLNVRKRPPLYDEVLEIHERLNADGSVAVPLEKESSRARLQQAYDAGYRVLAICLLHAVSNPEHERAVERLAKEIGFEFTVLSHQVSPMIKAVSRAETTVVDAYLTPIVQTYLKTLTCQFQQTSSDSLLIMTSAGGLLPTDEYRGKDSVLSGPAGGAVAIQAMAKATGLTRFIGLDMGGTSTDVCRVDDELDLEFETVKAGVRMQTPTLRIHTVAAGGGSICWFDGVLLRVGPQSAGANPGPACYGRGGPLTVTDLNLLTGRLDPASFPFPLDRESAELAFSRLQDAIHLSRPSGPAMSRDALLEGFREIANEHMASAVRSISVAQGADPRHHTLVCFGGAAGQHICQIADRLGIESILDPPQAGLLSAVGMGMGKIQRTFSRSVYQPVNQLDTAWFSESIRESIPLEYRNSIEWTISLRIEARYVGSEGTLSLSTTLDEWDPKKIEEAFIKSHRRRFGYVRSEKTIEVTAIHAMVTSRTINSFPDLSLTLPLNPSSGSDPAPIQAARVHRDAMTIGAVYAGPLLIQSAGSTTLLETGWEATVLEDRTLWLQSKTPKKQTPPAVSTRLDEFDGNQVDPVLREVLAQRIGAIAEQMGTVLEQTAISVNIKDRKDFSCAVFNGSGDLIANAPHVPVHLGAMSSTVKQIIELFPDLADGDCFITNDPYRGGSHLPDITVVTPVFPDPETRLRFFVACRAHHAEIGGIAPGSMSPTAVSLSQEGVLIEPMRITRKGEDCTAEVEKVLRSAPWPTRNAHENLADIAAQQAANQFGVQALLELAQSTGAETLSIYMEHIQAASQKKTERWIESLSQSPYTLQDWMDDGTPICVRIEKSLQNNAPKLRIDFSGTGKESAGNLNANPAIVMAATMYSIRCALSDELPLNSGVMRCIDLVIPDGLLNPQRRSEPLIRDQRSKGIESDHWPAVAGGNVETSQRVVDCLLGALGLAAASQGTMNNFLFGDASFGYYETICGGAGATPDGRGEDAVHTHMTNTRLTDVEVLERRYPVRLERFEIRRGSGGRGMHRGGDGIVRQVKALKPLTVSLVTSRRGRYLPQGLEGGCTGERGENWWIQSDGKRTQLDSNAQIEIQLGDSICLFTPGGGGWGVEASGGPAAADGKSES